MSSSKSFSQRVEASWASQSTSAIFLPLSAWETARWTAIVVLPTPPLEFASAISMLTSNKAYLYACKRNVKNRAILPGRIFLPLSRSIAVLYNPFNRKLKTSMLACMLVSLRDRTSGFNESSGGASHSLGKTSGKYACLHACKLYYERRRICSDFTTYALW